MKLSTIKTVIISFVICSTQILDLFIFKIGEGKNILGIPFGWFIRGLLCVLLITTIWPLSKVFMRCSSLVNPLTLQ